MSCKHAPFWDRIAKNYTWFQFWDQTCAGSFAEAHSSWFVNGKTNLSVNCLDRHAATTPDKVALIWERNNPEEASVCYTYKQLLDAVKIVAAALRVHGIQKGDRVCLYLPMIPELPILMLACARIGAVHTVVFAGFSAKSVRERIEDSQSKIVFTTNTAQRGQKELFLKKIVDDSQPSVPVYCIDDETWISFLAKGAAAAKEDTALQQPEHMDSEDPLFILYTSGSTGKPKGLLHTTGGYIVNAGHTFREVFDYRAEDIYWCTADIGWITGHTYLVYGPLLNGATIVLFEGIPTYPDPGRFWQVVEKHKVSLFYTAPTVIRSLEKEGETWPLQYDLSSLRVLGTVGEPINEEAWHWYDRVIGKENCPVVDTWWQTENGAIMISARANKTEPKPGYATYPLEGIEPCLVNENGEELTGVAEGYLCIKEPWPSLARSIWGDHDRYKTTYFTQFPGTYCTGDGARRDADGRYRITGRVDDVMNISGHRLGTAEIEDAIDEHSAVIETALVGVPHPIKGQAIYAFVSLQQTASDHDQLRQEIREMVATHISPIAKPDYIQFVTSLPKTRSGKIMRRVLRAVVTGQTEYGDVSTLLDPGIIPDLVDGRIEK